jgi:type VI secretion system protein
VKERRLLERIAAWEGGGERTNKIQVDILITSGTEHLRRLLNTRQGSVQLDPKFGVPDFTNLAGGLT